MIVRPAGEPRCDLGRHVGGIVIHDDMDIEPFRDLSIDLFEELQALDRSVTLVAFADHNPEVTWGGRPDHRFRGRPTTEKRLLMSRPKSATPTPVGPNLASLVLRWRSGDFWAGKPAASGSSVKQEHLVHTPLTSSAGPQQNFVP
jgi:hypothetical protein